MGNNKQSSVDFFAEKTFNLIELMKSRYVNQEEFLDGMLKAREQAKARHKQEVTNAHTHGRNVERGMDDGVYTSLEYYNETFGGNK